MKWVVPFLILSAFRSHTGTHHTQALHDAYGGPKEIIVAEGDHNTLRSAKSLLAIGSFLKKELAPDSTRDAGEAVDAFGSLPWRRGRQIRDVGYGPDAVDALRSKIDGTLGGQKESRQWCLDQAHYYCNRGNTLEESGKVEALSLIHI